MAEVSLKALSNQTLLDIYYEYRKEKEHYIYLSKRATVKFWEDKIKIISEYLEQIELEILSRMFGMEID